MDRLAALDPSLLDAIARLAEDGTRRTLAHAVAAEVAGRLGVEGQPAVAAVLDNAVRASVEPTAVAELEQLVQHLDERAWDLQKAGEDDRYLQAFAKARAANAVLEYAAGGSDGNLGDVLYEAHAATNDLSFIRGFVQR